MKKMLEVDSKEFISMMLGWKTAFDEAVRDPSRSTLHPDLFDLAILVPQYLQTPVSTPSRPSSSPLPWRFSPSREIGRHGCWSSSSSTPAGSSGSCCVRGGSCGPSSSHARRCRRREPSEPWKFEARPTLERGAPTNGK